MNIKEENKYVRINFLDKEWTLYNMKDMKKLHDIIKKKYPEILGLSDKTFLFFDDKVFFKKWETINYDQRLLFYGTISFYLPADNTQVKRKKLYNLVVDYYINKDFRTITNIMTNLLYDHNLLNTFTQIMQSEVIKNYYKHIHIYSNKEDVIEAHTKQSYEAFIKFLAENDNKLNESFVKQYIIPVHLNEYYKGLTSIYQRIGLNINVQCIQDINSNMNELEIQQLLSAYLILVILYETNHFLRRWNWKGINKEGMTHLEQEGGWVLFQTIFNDKNPNTLNILQAEAILNISNWNSIETLKKKIRTNCNSTITFMDSFPHYCCVSH